MWISKKKWKELSDENSALKQRVKDMEHLSMAVEAVNGKGSVYYIGGNYYLVNIYHYDGLIKDLRELKKESKESKEEANDYKKRYLDELQKRLELADKVRELEGK